MKLELNYPLEIKNHELMNKIADENQNFKINIPAIHRSLSNVNIIVTDCISNSVNLLEWQETSPADNKKIEVINSLFDFLNFCVFKKNVLYADPHYGNILISEDSKIHIVDFGLIYSLTNEELQHFNLVVNSVQQDDYQAFKVTQEKNIIVPKEETFQFLWTYSKNIISPLFEDKLFLITEEQVSTLTQLVDTNVSSLNIKTNVSDLLFLKMYLNIMCIIAKFKVKINLYQYSKKYLDVVTSV